MRTFYDDREKQLAFEATLRRVRTRRRTAEAKAREKPHALDRSVIQEINARLGGRLVAFGGPARNLGLSRYESGRIVALGRGVAILKDK